MKGEGRQKKGFFIKYHVNTSDFPLSLAVPSFLSLAVSFFLKESREMFLKLQRDCTLLLPHGNINYSQTFKIS